MERLVLILTVCIAAATGLGRVGAGLSHAVAGKAGPHVVAEKAVRASVADSRVARLTSQSSGALQLVGGVLRKLSDGVTSTFAKVDALPEPGSELFQAARDSLAAQMRTQGYAIVDLRSSDVLLNEFRRNHPHREANLASWFNQLADARPHGLRLRTGGFGYAPEDALKTGTLHWHPDARPFTALWQIDGLGTQIVPGSTRWDQPLFDRVVEASSRAYVGVGRKTNLRSMAEKLAVVQRYDSLLDDILPGVRSMLEEGSVFTEPGELLVFLGRPSLDGAGRFSPPPSQRLQLPFGPMLHRRPAERLNSARTLWIARGEDVRIDDLIDR